MNLFSRHILKLKVIMCPRAKTKSTYQYLSITCIFHSFSTGTFGGFDTGYAFKILIKVTKPNEKKIIEKL